MKLWEITIINAFGIDEQTIEINGNNLLIEGGTGSGKTSILDSIDACFFGPKERVIRDPSKPAKFIITTEEYAFERSIVQTDKGEPKTFAFVIRRGDVTIKAPATFAKKVVRAQSMRPLVFFEATPAERRAMLLRALPIELSRAKVLEIAREHLSDETVRDGENEVIGNFVDDRMEYLKQLVKMPDIDWEAHAFDIAKRLYTAAYDARHRIGQDYDGKMSIVSGIRALTKKPYDEGAHAEATRFVNRLTVVSSQLAAANNETEKLAQKATEFDRQVAELDTRIEKLSLEITALNERREIAKTAILMNTRAVVAARTTKVQLIDQAAAIDHRCAEQGIGAMLAYWIDEERVHENIIAANAEIDRQTDAGLTAAQEEVAQLGRKRAAYDVLTKFAERILPATLIKEVERSGRLPLKGLMIDGERIRFNDTSIDVLSSGQRMHFAMQLALAVLQPLDDEDALKLICVDDFERLDAELQQIVAQYERPGEVQFIKTRVKSGPLTIQQYDPTTTPPRPVG